MDVHLPIRGCARVQTHPQNYCTKLLYGGKNPGRSAENLDPGERWTFQLDSDPKHSTKVVQK